MYLTQGAIAANVNMRTRVAACAAQQGCLDAGIDPDAWTSEWRRVWAASPGWDEAWEYALNTKPDADPGEDSSVITDEQILSQVQSMMPFEHPSTPVIPVEAP